MFKKELGKNKMKLSKYNKFLTMMLMFLVVCVSYLEYKNKIITKIFSYETPIEICKNNLHYRKNIFDNINDRVSNFIEVPESFIAVKSLSERGLEYLLLMNFEINTELLTYSPKKGFITRSYNNQDGINLFNNIITTDYKKANDNFEYDSFHTTCYFVRVFDSKKEYNFNVVNSHFGEDKPSIRIIKYVQQFLNNIYKNVIQNEKIPEIAPDHTEAEINMFNRKLSNDLFFELKRIGLDND